MSKRALTILAFMVGGTAVYGTALAAGWGDYEKAFPAFPCSDGWAACIVDGKTITPDLAKGSDGQPMPADMRVGWDLQPTAVFSPFSGLSAYTGALPATPPPETAANTTTASSGSTDQASSGSPSSGSSGSSGSADVASNTPSSGSTSAPAPTADPSTSSTTTTTTSTTTTASNTPATTTTSTTPPASGSSMVRPSSSTDPVASNTTPAGSSGSVRPSSTSTPASLAPSTTPAGTADAPPSSGSVRPSGTAPSASISVAPSAAAAAGPVDDSCDNLTKLEPQAMLGKMSPGQIQCLEKAFTAAPKQTDKDKISRVLMANAWSKGDTKDWERLIKRHLEEVDQSDPDLCYKYALQLSKQGPGRADGVIRWANVALENKTMWTGQTYQDRVSGLYKLRAAAAQSQWKAAETANASNPTDDTGKKVETARGQTKVFAREWFEYLKAAGKDTTTALQLCVSAAGTKDYCEGS